MKRTAEEIMTKSLITIGWNDSMVEALALMREHKLRHLPVAGDDGNLIGILSDRDIKRAMRPQPDFDIEALGQLYTENEFEPGTRVRTYMSWPIKSVQRTTDLREVAGLMVTDKISAVLVMSGKQYLGIVTTEDLLKILMSVLGHAPLQPNWNWDTFFGMEMGLAGKQI